MVIAQIDGGLGNQLVYYAAGRSFAQKLNTELKLEIFNYNDKLRPYVLDQFNITAPIATPEEIISCKKNSFDKNSCPKNISDLPDDFYIYGMWGREFFEDIRDILLKEFTLKNPLSPAAEMWKKKILSADSSVSMHFRHGDYIYNPNYKNNKVWADIPPPDVYGNCVNFLKQHYKNLTVFVFSNNLQWVKQNLRLDVPTEYIEGEDLTDVEEFYLMSLCKHNIFPHSTFSWWAAWLNQNPDKKIFRIFPADAEEVKNYQYSLTPKQEYSPLDPDDWIRVPFDRNKQPEVIMRPYFSLLLVVNNDIATLQETLGSILSQDYKFFELIIIDNASFDGSDKICQQVAKNSDKVTLIKLWNKISNGAAWNKAFEVAQGDFVMFLKGNDKIFSNVLSSTYLMNERPLTDIVNSVAWLREDANGPVTIAGRKFSLEKDAPFNGLQGNIHQHFDKQTVLRILASNATLVPFATKIFKRKFLLDNGIKFDEHNADSEIIFTTNAMFKADEMFFTPNVFYVAPKI